MGQPARRYLQTSRKTRSIMAFTRVTAFVALALLGCALADDFRVEEANPRTDNNGNLYGLDVKSDGQMFLFIIKDKLPQGALSEGQEYFPVSNIYRMVTTPTVWCLKTAARQTNLWSWVGPHPSQTKARVPTPKPKPRPRLQRTLVWTRTSSRSRTPKTSAFRVSPSRQQTLARPLAGPMLRPARTRSPTRAPGLPSRAQAPRALQGASCSAPLECVTSRTNEQLLHPCPETQSPQLV